MFCHLMLFYSKGSEEEDVRVVEPGNMDLWEVDPMANISPKVSRNFFYYIDTSLDFDTINTFVEEKTEKRETLNCCKSML